MKHVLNIYADAPSTDGHFLLEIAICLSEHRFRPEALVLSTVGPDKVKVWIVLAPGHERNLPGLLERFRGVYGVTKVEIEEPPAPSAPPVITR